MSKELGAFRIMVKDNGLELPYHNTIIAVETALKEKDKNDEILRLIKECPDELKWVDFCDEFELLKGWLYGKN